jgi:hypothetical protein
MIINGKNIWNKANAMNWFFNFFINICCSGLYLIWVFYIFIYFILNGKNSRHFQDPQHEVLRVFYYWKVCVCVCVCVSCPTIQALWLVDTVLWVKAIIGWHNIFCVQYKCTELLDPVTMGICPEKILWPCMFVQRRNWWR